MGTKALGTLMLLSSLVVLLVAGCASSKNEVQEQQLVGEEPQIEEQVGEMKCAVAVTNIREERSKDAKIVGKLNPGQKVRAAFLQDNWYAVFDPDATDLTEENALGYVSASRLKPVAGQSGAVKYVRAATHIREARSKGSKVVGKLNPGQKVRAAFLQDDWYAVFNPEATDLIEKDALGYVYAPLLKDAQAEAK
jgi:ubiquinone biosynthesis protein Coq4